MFQAHAQQLLNQKESQNDPEGRETPADALFSATERLMDALDRLESRVEEKRATVHSDAEERERAAFYSRENEVLKQEREGLNATIAQLESEYADLQKTTGIIYKKLNDAIKRLNNIIGD